MEAGSPARKVLKSSGLQIMRVWSGMEKTGVMERELLALLVEDWRERSTVRDAGVWLEEAGP